MTSLRQTEANRANARKSTGPRSDEGKARSRGNALKHGLAGDGVVLPDAEAQAVAHRLESWRDAFRPETGEDEWLFRMAVLNSVRIDRCQALEPEVRAAQARRASVCWDDDRRLDAEEAGASLARSPSLVRRRLAGTRRGCEWLLLRWRALGEAFERSGDWTSAQRSLAHDLLGTPPVLRGDDPVPDPLGLVAREVARLEGLKDGPLEDLDESERVAAETGLEIRPNRELTRLRRYEAACVRLYQWARARLSARSRSGPPEDRPDTPPPAAPPIPRSSRPPHRAAAPATLPAAAPAATPVPVAATPLRVDPAPVRLSRQLPVPPPPPLTNRRARRAALKLAGRR